MILYYLFLLLVPFQDHPILGAQLIHFGSFPVTPIKLVGIPLVALALILPRPRDAAPRPGIGILVLFATFTFYQVLGTTLSSLSFPTLDASTLAAFAILMVATNILINTPQRLQMTVRVIVLVETFASTWMYKQYYIYHWPRPLGPSADPNYEALSLVIAVPLAIWLARYETRAIWKRAAQVCTPILAFAVFLSQSRGGLLALGVMGVLAWFNSRHKLRLLTALAGAIVLMFAIAPGQMLERIQQIQLTGQAETGAEVSTRQRVELAKAGINMMAAHPLFGVGLTQFAAAEFEYNPALTGILPDPKIAHDTYVQLGAEGGLPTLALYVAILLLTISTCRNARKLPGVPQKFSDLALSFQAGLIGVMVAEFFLTAEYIKEVWVLISLAPNLYAIAFHLSGAATIKRVSAEIPPSTAIVSKPLRRAG